MCGLAVVDSMFSVADIVLVVLLLLIHCLLLALFGGFDWTLFCYAVLSVHTIFPIILMS